MIRTVSAVVIGLTVAGLIAINVVLYETPVDLSPMAPVQRTGSKSPPGAAQSTATLDANGFAETFERPLFSPTRRKFVPVPVEPKPVQVAAAPATPQLQAPGAPIVAPSLLGIVIGSGTARALLKPAGTVAADWYANGEIIDGWTVSAIDKDQAVLTRDGRQARLSLYPAAPKTAAGGNGFAQ